MDLRGDHQRLTGATGWEPEIPLRQTMADTIDWWERELSSTEARGSAQHKGACGPAVRHRVPGAAVRRRDAARN